MHTSSGGVFFPAVTGLVKAASQYWRHSISVGGSHGRLVSHGSTWTRHNVATTGLRGGKQWSGNATFAAPAGSERFSTAPENRTQVTARGFNRREVRPYRTKLDKHRSNRQGATRRNSPWHLQASPPATFVLFLNYFLEAFFKMRKSSRRENMDGNGSRTLPKNEGRRRTSTNFLSDNVSRMPYIGINATVDEVPQCLLTLRRLLPSRALNPSCLRPPYRHFWGDGPLPQSSRWPVSRRARATRRRKASNK